MMIGWHHMIHEVSNAAPFTGAIISTKAYYVEWDAPYRTSAESLIQMVQERPNNKGIILKGAYWAEQIEETVCLAKCAKEAGLEVMIWVAVGTREDLKGCYVLEGDYDHKRRSSFHYSKGIKLDSTNQRVVKL